MPRDVLLSGFTFAGKRVPLMSPQQGIFKPAILDVPLDNQVIFSSEDRVAEEGRDDVRRYITAAVQKRLHQRTFRQRVISAYRAHCAVCSLRHDELLEAAHILSDGHPRGVPTVPNGIALCKLHHAAFDAHFLGVTPDYDIAVREDVLNEHDGPMLIHGLQGFHGARLHTPRNELLRPNKDFLAERYELFKQSI